MKLFVRTLLSVSVVHWLTSIGVVLTTASAAVFLVLVSQRFENPYFGIIVFLVIPSLFVLGLLLMPIGLFLAARRLGGYRYVLARVPVDGPRLTRLGWALLLLLIMASVTWTRDNSAVRRVIRSCNHNTFAIRVLRTRACPAWTATSVPAQLLLFNTSSLAYANWSGSPPTRISGPFLLLWIACAPRRIRAKIVILQRRCKRTD